MTPRQKRGRGEEWDKAVPFVVDREQSTERQPEFKGSGSHRIFKVTSPPRHTKKCVSVVPWVSRANQVHTIKVKGHNYAC